MDQTTQPNSSSVFGCRPKTLPLSYNTLVFCLVFLFFIFSPAPSRAWSALPAPLSGLLPPSSTTARPEKQSGKFNVNNRRNSKRCFWLPCPQPGCAALPPYSCCDSTLEILPPRRTFRIGYTDSGVSPRCSLGDWWTSWKGSSGESCEL